MSCRYVQEVPLPPFSRSWVTASVPSLLAVALTGGCQQSDLEGAQSRSITEYVTDRTAEGKLEYRIASMLDGTSRKTAHLYFPRPGMYLDGEVEVVFPEGFDDLERGTYLRAEGDFDPQGRLIADTVDVVALPGVPLIDPEWAPLRRIATILVFWDDSGGMPNGAARAAMFTDNASTHVFYSENSYGGENVIGEVFGPYQIDDPGGCATAFIADRAVAAMEEKGHDPDDYIQFMFQFPSIGGCGFGGLANLGSPDMPAKNSWYNGSFGCVTRNQEIGHNYGMNHSRSYSCVDAEGVSTPFSDTCSEEEYGNPYDPMGGGCGHVNSVQKTYMGWLEGCNIVTAPNNGSFNLMPTELPCNGTQSLKIPASDGRYYYLEYRQPIGEFDGLSAVLLHVGPGEFNAGPTTYILDFGANEYMLPGETFVDPLGTVEITYVEGDETRAVIQVNYPNGGVGDPSCADGEVPLVEGGNVGTLECAAEPVAGDVVPPEVQITFPEDGAYFLPGSDFQILAEASDDRIVADLQLYLDGEPLFKLLEEPWEYDVNNIPEGTYEFGIVARDGVNFTPSNTVTIQVTEDIPQEPEADSTGSGGGEPADDGTTGAVADTGDETTGDPGAADPGGDSCACSSDGQRGAPMAGLLGVILLGLRRRRRASQRVA